MTVSANAPTDFLANDQMRMLLIIEHLGDYQYFSIDVNLNPSF